MNTADFAQRRVFGGSVTHSVLRAGRMTAAGSHRQAREWQKLCLGRAGSKI